MPWSMVHRDRAAGQLARAGDKAMEVKCDVRLYRPKRRMGSLGEAVWKAVTG